MPITSPLRERKDPFDELSSSTSVSPSREEVSTTPTGGQWTITPSSKLASESNTPSSKVASQVYSKATPLPKSLTPVPKTNTPFSKVTTPMNAKKTPAGNLRNITPRTIAVEETDDEIILSMKNTPKKKPPTSPHVVISPVKEKKGEEIVIVKKRENVFDRLYKGAFKGEGKR